MPRKRNVSPSTPQAVAYVRVSTPGQRDEGVSLDAQRAKITAWCEVMGYELVTTYADEGISGHSMDKRPGLQQAIDDACTRGGVLVVYSLSRLARNTRETLELGETVCPGWRGYRQTVRKYRHHHRSGQDGVPHAGGAGRV